MRPSDVVDVIVAAAVDPALRGRSGLVLGPDRESSQDLVQFVTPEIAASARELTQRMLAD